jgi:gliding motility-associated-like protein
MWKTNTKKLLILLSFFWSSFLPAQQAMKGKDFWLGFLQNSTMADSMKIYISAEKSTTGYLFIPGQNWSQNFTVNSGQVTEINIPVALAHNETSEMVKKTGIKVATEDSVNVFALNYHSASTDATYIIPSQFLKTDYLVISYKGIATRPSDALIVSTTDNTQIEIIPSVPTKNGVLAGQIINITLNEGETFLLRSYDGFDLTGTRIKGKEHCHPFAVFGGTVSAFIPEGCWYADHLFEQMLPLEYWGKEYVLAPLPKSTYTYRIIAAEDNTTVRINESQTIQLNSGKYITFNSVSNANYITSSAPVMVAQYLESGECSKIGDPALALLTPFDKPYKNISFSTSHIKNTRIKDHYLTIVGKSMAPIKLNGINLTFPRTYIPDSPGLYYFTLTIDHGAHYLESDESFVAYVAGVGEYESYFYMAGYSGQVFNPEIAFEDPICQGAPVTFTGTDKSISSWEWVFENNQILEGNNVTYTFETSGYQKVYILANRNNQDKCPDRFMQEIFVHPKPFVNLSGDEHICEGETLKLSVSGPAENNYQWSTGDTSDVLYVSNTGSYYLSTNNGICERKDTFNVKLLDTPEVKAISDYIICANEKVTLQTNHKNALEFLWSTGETSEEIIVNTEGSYTLTVSNKCGSAQADIFVTVFDLPELNAGSDTTILLGTSAWLKAQGYGNFLWNPPIGLSCSNCPDPKVFLKETTTYTLIITDKNGCQSIDSVTVFVDPDLAVFVPNIFSPNGDGANDVFFVRGKGVKRIEFMIFNRWGERIFEASDINEGWDGTHRGKAVNAGVFVYYIDAVLETDQRVIKKGDVTLIR